MILELVEQSVAAGARQERACEVLGISGRTLQRWRSQGEGGGEDRRHGPKHAPANKLSEKERRRILEVANQPEYRDLSPHHIVPRLADEQGTYVASVSSFYRVLGEEGQLAHRQRSRPCVPRGKPREQVATGPQQVLTWDITYLRSDVQGRHFYLYMILDVWSRMILGARVYERESSELAAELLREVCAGLGIDPKGIVLHSDNGSPMKGSEMLATMHRLGVIASFSRPRVSNDNPYSEALFRTLKYRPAYPGWFSSCETAQSWVDGFVAWYNEEHRHSALRFVTPADRHYGREKAILAQRRRVFERARRRHPQRWSGAVRNCSPIGAVTLNPENTDNKNASPLEAT